MRADNASTNYQAGHGQLSIQDVIEIARCYRTVDELTVDVEQRMRATADWVQEAVQKADKDPSVGVKPYYGINTGFGDQAGRSTLIDEYLTKVLSRNLVASHAVGVGPYFDEEIVRAAMIVRLHTLTQGYSGVRPILVQKLIAMLNQRVYAAVPSKGSLGSGDLAPLAHLALVLSKAPASDSDRANIQLDSSSGEAFVLDNEPIGQGNETEYHITHDRITGKQTMWRQVSGREAMRKAGGQVELYAKEGLSLVSGAAFSVAIASLAVHDALSLLENAELAAAMTLEAIRGFRDPFLPQVQAVYGHPGSIASARNILRFTKGSTLLDGNYNIDPSRVPPQDPVSIRAASQVLGAAHDALTFIKSTVTTELNAVTDNPLIFLSLPRDYKTISCGNFQSEALALSMDLLGSVFTVIGDIAERRIFQLTDYAFASPEKHAQYGLDPFLIKEPSETAGLNSGFMIPQYTAAALVSECKSLASPDSIDTKPTSANKEDHVSMSFNAARHAREIIDNIEIVVAIELLCAAQALSLRLNRAKDTGELVTLGLGTGAALRRIREVIPFIDADQVLYPHVRKAITLVRSGELPELVNSQLGDSGEA